MALTATKWSRKADYAGFGPDDTAPIGDTPGGAIANGGETSTMGYYCVFDMGSDTTVNVTHPFDFPIMGDFTVVVNSTGENLGGGQSPNVSVQGSVDGVSTNYIDLHDNIITSTDIDDNAAAAVYDYDAKGRMPYMRLEITQTSSAVNKAIIVNVVPQ